MPTPTDQGPSAVARGMTVAAQMSGLGMELAVPILGGYWLDQRWKTGPWMLLLGLVVGIYLFTIGVIRVSRDLAKKKS